jgi:hypothetical protein
LRTLIGLAAAAIVATAATVAGVVTSSASSSALASSAIHVCRSAKTGELFLWGACPRGYTAYSWAVTGPAGLRGATGPRGAAGPTGATGPAGVSGYQAETCATSTLISAGYASEFPSEVNPLCSLTTGPGNSYFAIQLDCPPGKHALSGGYGPFGSYAGQPVEPGDSVATGLAGLSAIEPAPGGGGYQFVIGPSGNWPLTLTITCATT